MINDDTQLDDLIRDRAEKVRLMKNDGDNSHRLLADLYGSPTHFIPELLQNAEDEGAQNVVFTLTEDKLIFEHDAKKLFDFNDIKAISNFGDNQDKKDKPNAIGRFGIGFKSVYSITDNPRIVSANYDITIRDYNVPEKNDSQNAVFFNGTRIILPFKAGDEDHSRNILIKELENLNLNYLLFLSSIQSIEWQTPKTNGKCEREISKKDNRFVTLKSSVKEIPYLLLSKNVGIGTKSLSVKLAFKLTPDKKSVTPCEESPLFVFFPTKMETNLKFLVHAPFYTTPARENIIDENNLSDNRNEILKRELGILLGESLTICKQLRLLNVDFLNLLPIDKELSHRSIIFDELYKATKNEFLSQKQLLPNSNGAFSSASNSMLLRSSELADLLNPKQALELFGRKCWLIKKISSTQTKALHNYLFHEIRVPEYDIGDLAQKVDKEFLEKQTDNWLINFYEVIHKAPAQWREGKGHNRGILRSKPIIRVEIKDGVKHVVPFQHDDKPNVFLPGKEKSKYLTVKLNIAKNPTAKSFLEELGLTKPDLFAEINEFIIPKLKNGNIYPDYFDDLKKILECLETTKQEKKEMLRRDLKECYFILGINYNTGEQKLLKANEIYFLSENLKDYFAHNQSIFYLSEDSYDIFENFKQAFLNLLRDIGVPRIPRKIQTSSSYLLSEDKKRLRATTDLPNQTWEKVTDFDLEGLTTFFINVTSNSSRALWEILISAPAEYFFGEYEWTSYSSYLRKVSFQAKFVLDLKSKKWLIDKFGNLVTPGEVSIDQLADFYNVDNSNSITLLSSILNFKPDEVKAIEERLGGKFVSGEELKRYEQWKASHTEDKVDEKKDTGFKPAVTPEEAEIISREFDSIGIEIQFDKEQGMDKESVSEFSDNGNSSDEKGQPEDDTSGKTDPKLVKEVGNWGQKYVFRQLQEEFKTTEGFEIVDLNRKGQKGVGCDFLIKSNDEIIRLIEVKSTVEKFGHSLTISGTQWEIARNYFKLNNGDFYWIYCVFNVGQEYPEIIKVKNPIKLWKEGKILAHPINFVIK